MRKKYQEDYAEGRAQMYDTRSRVLKATRIVKLLKDYYVDKDLRKLVCLDIGSSTGIIDNFLAQHFKEVIGIDIDKKAVKSAQKHFRRNNLKFKIGDAMKPEFKKNSFDVVVCLHIYEHVPDDKKLFKEIFRVLKPGGVCFFAAGNRLWPWEYHYNLPFLSLLPKHLAHYYVKLFGKGDEYYESLRTYWSLKKLTKNFEIIDYTPKILKSPKKFGFDNIFAPGSVVSLLAKIAAPLSSYFAPTFFWLLIKENNGGDSVKHWE